MQSKTLAIATLMAVSGALILGTTIVNIVPTYAKITERTTTTCDGEPGECPGSSSGPGRGHDEETETENVNPQGTAPPGHNK